MRPAQTVGLINAIHMECVTHGVKLTDTCANCNSLTGKLSAVYEQHGIGGRKMAV